MSFYSRTTRFYCKINYTTIHGQTLLLAEGSGSTPHPLWRPDAARATSGGIRGGPREAAARSSRQSHPRTHCLARHDSCAQGAVLSRAGVGAEVRRKYAHFDDAGVQKLNALAAATIARFASRVASDWRTCTTLRPSGPTARRTTLQRVTRDTTGLMCCKLCCNFTTSVGVFWGQVGMCSQYNL